MNRKPGALACAALLPLVVAGCSSNVRKPPPAPTQPAPQPQPPSSRVPAIQGGIGSAERIVSIARREHALWYQPFIDSNGRLASIRISEAEQERLADGSEAWQRVLGYWRNSGTLYEMAGSNIAGAYSCRYPTGYAPGTAECRTFLIDNAWSAAFVSYVMIQAGVPGFRSSPRHFDYIRQAYRGEGPYLFVDPATQRPAPGDLLCFVRGNGSIHGFAGLSSRLGSGNNGSLATHCDIVVGRDASHRELQVIGGNVFDSVTLRKLKLDPQGYAILPHTATSTGLDAYCGPNNESGCNFNRQNWAVLLKLKPSAAPPVRVTGAPAGVRYVTPQGHVLQPAAPVSASTAAPTQSMQPPSTAVRMQSQAQAAPPATTSTPSSLAEPEPPSPLPIAEPNPAPTTPAQTQPASPPLPASTAPTSSPPTPPS